MKRARQPSKRVLGAGDKMRALLFTGSNLGHRIARSTRWRQVSTVKREKMGPGGAGQARIRGRMKLRALGKVGIDRRA